jgi:hypothetical protein
MVNASKYYSSWCSFFELGGAVDERSNMMYISYFCEFDRKTPEVRVCTFPLCCYCC